MIHRSIYSGCPVISSSVVLQRLSPPLQQRELLLMTGSHSSMQHSHFQRDSSQWKLCRRTNQEMEKLFGSPFAKEDETPK